MDLTAFMMENADYLEDVSCVVSNRFKDENGKPVEWLITPITAADDAKLRKASYIYPKGKRNNGLSPTFDLNKYLKKLVVASTKYPDLNDEKLQNSYGVMDAEELIDKMLSSGEFQNYAIKIQDVNSFDVPLDDEIEEAKN